MRLVLMLLPFALATAAAQDDPPKRPKLGNDADTNDARAYYAWGNQANVSRARTAEARYWAYRLEPNDVSYFYGWWRALLAKQPVNWQADYFAGAKYAVKSREAKLIDSLRPDILQRNPFPFVRTPCYYPELVDSRDPVVASLMFLDRGCHQHAAERILAALERKPEYWGLHVERARSLFILQRYREAGAEITIVLDSLRGRDDKYLGAWYNTKEFLEHMLAVTLYRGRDIPGARGALERALTENLSYYPAHAMLSQIAMDQGDIKGALQEAELAVGLREHDGVLRYDYGVLLYRAGKLAEAEVQLAKAVELEPYWAEARRQLAVSIDKQDKRDEAVAAYEAFLARAPKRENIRITEAEERVAALRAAGT